MARIAVLPEDKQLPLLGVVTNTFAMRKTFQRQLPGFAEGRLQINGLNIKQLDYKPGKRCCICYKLRIKEVASGSEARQMLLGVIETNGGAETRYLKARDEADFQPAFVPAIHWLPELNMVLWAFPNDPQIKRLSAIVDKRGLREILQKNWSKLSIPPEFSLNDIETAVVKYVPQRRCTLRHVLRLEQSNGRGVSEVVIYSKIHSNKTDGAPFFRLLRGVWNAPVCQSGALLVPEPLFFDCDLNAIFQRGLYGRNLDELLFEIDLDDIAAKIGAALAALQQSPLEGLKRRARDYELADCAKVKERLSTISRVYEIRLAFVDAELRKRLANLTILEPTPIHGAFRLTQLLLAEEKIAFIDFDDFSLGNPIADVGSFVAHLLYLPLKGVMSEAQARSAIRHFCQAYRANAPWGLPADLLEWYTAAYLVGREAKKCQGKTNQLSNRDYEGMIDKLLEMSAGILAGRLRLI